MLLSVRCSIQYILLLVHHNMKLFLWRLLNVIVPVHILLKDGCITIMCLAMPVSELAVPCRVEHVQRFVDLWMSVELVTDSGFVQSMWYSPT